jgi:hypothetical protein
MAEVLIFGAIPWDAESIGDLVDVVKVVCEFLVCWGAGRLFGEVAARKAAVLVEFFKCAVFEGIASIPDPPSLLVLASIGDVLGPLGTLAIVLVEVSAREAEK